MIETVRTERNIYNFEIEAENNRSTFKMKGMNAEKMYGQCNVTESVAHSARIRVM